jgi:hypothetical protein
LEKLEAWMNRPEFEFDDSESRARDVAGSPEGDGDFETDGLPDTNETSAGGQVLHKTARRPETVADRAEPTGFERVLDEVSTGKILP